MPPRAAERPSGRLEAIWTLGGLSRLGFPRAHPVAQAPNLPLALGLAGLGAARVLDGGAAGAAETAGLLALGVWAGAEIVSGANLYRRVLGVAGLAYVAVRLL